LTDEAGHVDRTVLFADVAGSTRLYGRFGDEATKKMLRDCLDLMQSIVERSGGRVARRIGDELLCTFGNPSEAALAAMQLQSRVSDGHVDGIFPTPMRIRVGFEHGPIIEAEEALYGNVVHTAARIASLAKARQILVSAATARILNPALRVCTRFFDRAVLKGQSGEQEIHELIWSVSDSTAVGRRPAPPPSRRAGSIRFIDVAWGEERARADADRPQVDLGRDPSCDLRVEGDSVSQLHARVFWDRGEARVEDVSTNGTLILGPDGTSRALHHGRASLRGEGVLVLGDAQERARCAEVRFRCGT